MRISDWSSDVCSSDLDRVGLALRADDPVSALSHGERRLLEVALALALRPKLLLLDEPMAGLGPEGTQALTAFLAALKHEAGLLLVEQDLDAVFALADRSPNSEDRPGGKGEVSTG